MGWIEEEQGVGRSYCGWVGGWVGRTESLKTGNDKHDADPCEDIAWVAVVVGEVASEDHPEFPYPPIDASDDVGETLHQGDFGQVVEDALVAIDNKRRGLQEATRHIPMDVAELGGRVLEFLHRLHGLGAVYLRVFGEGDVDCSG